MKLFVRFLIKFISMILIAMPRWLQLKLGDLLGFVAFDIVRLRRKLMMEHLAVAFPDWSEKRKRQVARKSLQHMGRSFIEYFIIPSVDKDWVEKNVTVTGEEYLRQAMEPAKGVLLLTLHVGNGDLALAVLALMGLHLGIVSKRFKNPELNAIWFGLRKKEGLDIIPEEKSSYQILRYLKQKAFVVFVLDQFMGPPVGVKTTFFGKETGTAAGMALFAQRSGAPVLPAYTFRDANGHTHIVFEPPLMDSGAKDEDLDKKLVRLTQQYTNIIEGIVRKHPDQWLWLHRRWKIFEAR